MANVILLFGLCTYGYAQLIYPDQFATMQKAAGIPTTYPMYPSTDRESRVDPPVYVSAQYPNNPPLSLSGPGSQQYPTNPPQMFIGQGYSTLQPQPQPQRPPPRSPPPAAPTAVDTSVYQNSQGASAAGFGNPSLAPDWSEHVNGIISRGITKFALDVQRELYRTNSLEDNIVFSPLNIAGALAMVLLGSAGRTFEEVSKVLGLESGVDISRNSEVVHQMFGILLNRVVDNIITSPGPRVDIASGVFVQDGYSIRPEFKTVSENVYRSEVINLDFQNQPKEAQRVVNTWVKDKTRQKITQILSDAPDRATKVMLVSALYFNGEWNQHFIRGATKRRPFLVEPDAEPINIDMMYNGGVFQFYEDRSLGVKIVRLPYKGQTTAMYVLLPSTPGAKALRDFQNQITADTLDSLIGKMKNETCILGFPRMKLSSTWSLRRTLRSLGLSSLFDQGTADLSLLSQGQSSSRPSPQPTPATMNPRTIGLTRGPLPIRPNKSGGSTSQLASTNDLFIFPRFGEMGGPDMTRQNYFAYDDKVRGLSVQQWATGFSITSLGRGRRHVPTENPQGSTLGDPASFYNVEDQASKPEHTKVASLEQNKYKFESEPQKEVKRTRRQSRAMDQDFLNYIRNLNLPSYGLDDLRNNANLVNPGLYASDVLHKVEIDVTETGTEAAATTAVIIERDGNQKRLVGNRPFIFVIRHDPTKLVLFWGTVNKPTPNYPAA